MCIFSALDAELRAVFSSSCFKCSDYPIFRGKTTDTHGLEIHWLNISSFSVKKLVKNDHYFSHFFSLKKQVKNLKLLQQFLACFEIFTLKM
jgi:hypothetical protein